MHTSIIKDTNKLFPVFLKLEELSVLIVGGGKVGLEKLNAILKNSPGARIRVVASVIGEPLKSIAEQHSNIRLIEEAYSQADHVIKRNK